MKIGIKKLECIATSKIKSWNHLGRNSRAVLSPFFEGTLTEILFTGGTASLEEEWLEHAGGIYSQVTATGTIRASAKEMVPILSSGIICRNVYCITTMEDEKLVIGSLDFVPRLTFKRIVAGITTSEYQFTIICKSPHGLITDTSV